jgi:hypothetical protein
MFECVNYCSYTSILFKCLCSDSVVFINAVLFNFSVARNSCETTRLMGNTLLESTNKVRDPSHVVAPDTIFSSKAKVFQMNFYQGK